MSRSITVLSLNTGHNKKENRATENGKTLSHEQTIDSIKNLVERNSGDILALNECQKAQNEDLVEALGKNYDKIDSVDKDKKAIIYDSYKMKPTEKDSIELGGGKCGQHVKFVDNTGHEVSVLNVHLSQPRDHERRAMQLGTIMEMMTANPKLVVTGDFNLSVYCNYIRNPYPKDIEFVEFLKEHNCGFPDKPTRFRPGHGYSKKDSTHDAVLQFNAGMATSLKSRQRPSDHKMVKNQNIRKGQKDPWNFTKVDATLFDRRSELIRSGKLVFNKDGKVRDTCKAVKDGIVFLKDGRINLAHEGTKALMDGSLKIKPSILTLLSADNSEHLEKKTAEPNPADIKALLRFTGTQKREWNGNSSGRRTKAGLPDMRYSENRKTAADSHKHKGTGKYRWNGNSKGPKTKLGKPDLRFKENRSSPPTSNKTTNTPVKKGTVNALKGKFETKSRASQKSERRGANLSSGTRKLQTSKNSKSASRPQTNAKKSVPRSSARRVTGTTKTSAVKAGTKLETASLFRQKATISSGFTGSTHYQWSGNSHGPTTNAGLPDMRYKQNRASSSPPTRTYTPPTRSYSPPTRSYSPPTRSYSPPTRSYSPPTTSYSSYSPPSSDYSGSACYDWSGNTDGPTCADGTPDMRYSSNRM